MLPKTNQIDTFLTECGTRYVRSVYKGHLLDTTVNFQIREDQDSASSATSLSIGVKDLFEVSGSSAEAHARVSLIARVDTTEHGLGRFSVPQPKKPAAGGTPVTTLGTDPATPAPNTPPGSNPPPDPSSGTSAQAGANTGSPQGPSKIDKLLEWYENGFEAAVQADLDTPQVAGQPKRNSALPLYATLDRYRDKQLPYKERIPTWPDGIYKAIGDRAARYNDLVSAIAELESVTSAAPSDRLKDFYDGETEQTVSEKRTKADGLLTGFQAAAVACGNYVAAGRAKTSAGADVVTDCADKLDKAIPKDALKGVQLKRKYKDMRPPGPAPANP